LKINHIFTVPGNALETHVSPENKIRVQSPDPAQRVLVNEIGAYELIFGINMPMSWVLVWLWWPDDAMLGS
jgi:hypothetical protein